MLSLVTPVRVHTLLLAMNHLTYYSLIAFPITYIW